MKILSAAIEGVKRIFYLHQKSLTSQAKERKKQLGNTFMTVLSLAGMRNLITGSLHRLSLTEVHHCRSLFFYFRQKN